MRKDNYEDFSKVRIKLSEGAISYIKANAETRIDYFDKLLKKYAKKSSWISKNITCTKQEFKFLPEARYVTIQIKKDLYKKVEDGWKGLPLNANKIITLIAEYESNL